MSIAVFTASSKATVSAMAFCAVLSGCAWSIRAPTWKKEQLNLCDAKIESTMKLINLMSISQQQVKVSALAEMHKETGNPIDTVKMINDKLLQKSKRTKAMSNCHKTKAEK